MIENTKLLGIIIAVAITGTVGGLFLIAYTTYFPPSIQSIPFTLYNGINIGDYFATPLSTSFSVVSDTPTIAPAITGCKLTNDIHLIATDGSDYGLSSSSSVFSATYSVVSNAYNGKNLDSVFVNVNLYCDPSTLSQYNYFPNLTGGFVNVVLQGRTPSGNLVNIYNSGQSVKTVTVNGQTATIATFVIPAYQIASTLPSSNSNYYSQQNVVTTGTLYFKQNLQIPQPTATHVISPLYTSFSFLISSSPSTTQSTQTIPTKPTITLSSPVAQPTSTACQSYTIPFYNSCINLVQTVTLAGDKTVYNLPTQNYVIYSIIVNDWNIGQQPYPVVKITNLDTQTSTIMTLSPNSRPNGYPIIATAGTSLVVTDILNFNSDLNGIPGRYQIQLLPIQLGSYSRPTVSQDFVIYNPNPNTVQGNPVTCQPNYYLSNGVCYPANTYTPTCPPGQTIVNGYCTTGTPNNTNCNYGTNPNGSCVIPPAPGTTSPVSLPTQSSNNVCVALSGNSGMCVPSNTFLGSSPIIAGIQQILLYFHAFG